MTDATREDSVVNARIVFWGAEGAGKTANLDAIFAKLRPDHRGELRSVPTPFDPTASYEELPIELGNIAGVRTQIQLVAVPGAPEQAPTRKQLLDEVDGIVLVVDSQSDRIDDNIAAAAELRAVLAEYGRDIDEIPLVVQHNKRDLGDPFAQEELHKRLALETAPVFEAVATEQTGVLQTLSTISKRVIRTLRRRTSDDKPEPEPVEPPIAAEPPEITMPELAPPTTSERIEEAILHETEHPAQRAIDETAQQAESLLDPSWDPIARELDGPAGVRVGPDLSIVSAGDAERTGDRTVRLPLVLGDGEGNTSTLVLTIQLDALLDEN
ncbi:MAG: ATP/GTP-binding protein [Myxococcota bacterium]